MHADSETQAPDAPRRDVAATCCDCGGAFTGLELFVFDGWLRVTPRCEPCRVKALEEFKAAEQRSARLHREKVFADQIGRDAFTDTRRELVPNPDAFDAVTAWTFGPQGLALVGATGRAKTRILWELLRRLWVEEGIRFEFVRATAFARAVSDETRVSEYLRNLSRVPVLAFDDLGTEFTTERGESSLLELLDRRVTAKLPTLITTNYPGDKLVTRFRNEATANAIVRRIRESSKGVRV